MDAKTYLLTLALAIGLEALALAVACSADVTVHGIPDQIHVCTTDCDAGADGDDG